MNNKEYYKYVSSNLKAERCRRNKSQQEMADLIGKTRRQYINYEKTGRIDSVILWEISQVLNCDMSRFFLEMNFTHSEKEGE